MITSVIVAVDEEGAIGKDGQLSWRLPKEQATFKQITKGHPIIMGRKTYESINRALPERTNIVITRQQGYVAEGCKVVHSLEAAIEEANIAQGSDEIFIIGGAEIYQQAASIANRLYLTIVHTIVNGDTFFSYAPSDWKEVSRREYKADANNSLDYDFIVLERK